jgi:hypothetical protein
MNEILHIILFIIFILLFILFYYKLCIGFNYSQIETLKFIDHKFKKKNIPIFILNLKKEISKKENMEKLLDFLNFTNYKFIVPIDKFESIKDPLVSHMPLPESSHSLTMYFILKYCVDHKINEFIIMEDDLELFKNNYKNIDLIFEEIKNYNFDLFYLEYLADICDKQIILSDNLIKLYAPFGAACIYYTLSGAKKILDNFYLIKEPKIIDNKDNKDNIYYDGFDGITKKSIQRNLVNAIGAKIFKQSIKFKSSLTLSTRSNIITQEFLDRYCI